MKFILIKATNATALKYCGLIIERSLSEHIKATVKKIKVYIGMRYARL